MQNRSKKIKYSLRFIPDKLYLQIYYFVKFKKFCNFKNPQTFNEKLQWIKLYDRRPEYTKMVDKFRAKMYVAKIIGKKYIIPTLGVWDKFEDIDFHSLPEQFVLKCTHDSNGTVVCRDKKTFNKKAAREQINQSLQFNYYYVGREWPYKNVKPRIIAEAFMSDDPTVNEKNRESCSNDGLTDYKFYCFDGEPKFLYISSGLEDHTTARISFLTLDWKFAPYQRTDYKPYETLPKRPEMFDEMIEISKKLSSGHRFLRVDLYQINGQVYFSELTFTPSSGLMRFKNPNHDREIGDMMKLSPN